MSRDVGTIAYPYDDQPGDELVVWRAVVMEWIEDHPSDAEQYRAGLDETSQLVAERIARSRQSPDVTDP